MALANSLALLLIIALSVGVFLFIRLRKTTAEREEARLARNRLEARFRGVVDADEERKRVLSDLEDQRRAVQQAIAALQQQARVDAATFSELERKLTRLRADLAALDEEANLQSFGFYKARYAFADSAGYQKQLEEIQGQQKKMLKDKAAATCSIEWSVNGSKTEGRKQINQTLRLMLRAFNGESDAAIAKVNYKNVNVMEARIAKAFEVINGLAEVQQCEISRFYRDLKLKELFLVHEYEEKKEEEREEQRRIKQQMREEELAQREIEKARQEAERDEAKYELALAKARAEAERAAGTTQERLLAQIAALQQKLDEAHANKERAIARAQLTRSGHVYVISNVGSFGEHVYKIGMTRRLDPQERIKELGDASVPFDFDVHAIIFSEDAPGLECTLHRQFEDRRLNRVNERKEFFNVTIDEITDAVRPHKADIEITRLAEAPQYRKTLAMIAEERGLASIDPLSARIPIRLATTPRAASPVASFVEAATKVTATDNVNVS